MKYRLKQKHFHAGKKGEFLEVERKFAKVWRAMLRLLSFDDVIRSLEKAGVSLGKCRSLEEAKQVAEGVVMSDGDKFRQMSLALTLLNIPTHLHQSIFVRWKTLGYKPLRIYAPYVAFVLTIDVFFYIAATSNLISTERVTNKVDLAYLFYLPFCMMFTSSDKLHRRCVPLFLRNDQKFIWGQDLKADLSKVDEYYDKFPQAEKEKGLYSIASTPPKEGDFLVVKLWDYFLPGWRRTDMTSKPRSKETDNKILESFRQIVKSRTLETEEIDFDMRNPDTVALKRSIRRRRGKWWQVAKDLKSGEEL